MRVYRLQALIVKGRAVDLRCLHARYSMPQTWECYLMKLSYLLLALLLLLPVPVAASYLHQGSGMDDGTVTVVGMVLTKSNTRGKSRNKGTPNRWTIDLDNDMNADLTLVSMAEDLTGSELVREAIWAEVRITPLDLENETYGLVRWVKFGLRD